MFFTPASYSEAPMLKSQTGNRLYGLRIFLFFCSVIPTHRRGNALKYATTEFIPSFFIERQSCISTLPSGWCWRTLVTAEHSALYASPFSASSDVLLEISYLVL